LQAAWTKSGKLDCQILRSRDNRPKRRRPAVNRNPAT